MNWQQLLVLLFWCSHLSDPAFSKLVQRLKWQKTIDSFWLSLILETICPVVVPKKRERMLGKTQGLQQCKVTGIKLAGPLQFFKQ